jgi:hypothetical protein
MTLDDQLSALLPKAIDPFSRSAIEGAQHALVDTANPLRLNFFCTAMRILFEHMIGTLAPVDQVIKTEWFVAERAANRAFLLMMCPFVSSELHSAASWGHRARAEKRDVQRRP